MCELGNVRGGWTYGLDVLVVWFVGCPITVTPISGEIRVTVDDGV